MKHFLLRNSFLIGAFFVYVGTTEVAGQNVGINTTAPTQTLDVNGQIRVRGLSGSGGRLPIVGADGTLGTSAPVYETAPIAQTFSQKGSIALSTVDIGISGSTAFVLSGNNLVQAIDISNPTSPVLRGSAQAYGRVRQIDVSGNTAYVAMYGTGSSASSVQLFGLSPSGPAAGSVINTSGVPVRVAGNQYAICISIDGGAYGGTSNNTLQVYPPWLVNPGTISTGSGPGKAVLNERIAYVRDSRGTEVFDVSSTSSPKLLGTINTSFVAASGKLGFNLSGGLSVYDISSPLAPVLLGTAPTVSGAAFLAVSGNTVFVSTGPGPGSPAPGVTSGVLQVFDISTPSAPVLRGTTTVTTNQFGNGITGLAASGNTACVIDGSSLQVFQFSGSPQTVSVNPDGSFGSMPSPTLSVSGQTLSISGGNSVSLPAVASSNGLTSSNGTLSLGGTLTQATTIAQGGFGMHFTGGSVGIGTTQPQYALDVVGTIRASGSMLATSFTTSDRRLKTNIQPLQGALLGVTQLRGVRYTFLPGKGPVGNQIGLLAQELEQQYPELVFTDPTTGLKAVNYAQLTPILVEALKEQQQQIEQLRTEASAATQRAKQAEATTASFEQRLRALESNGVRAQAGH